MKQQVSAGIGGQDVLVGPALIYSGDTLSVIVAHGDFGTAGTLSEVVLGEYAPEPDEAWLAAVDTVLSVRRSDQITMAEADEMRAHMIAALRAYKRTVEEFETDLDLAEAYAARFPSEQSRKVLTDIRATP